MRVVGAAAASAIVLTACSLDSSGEVVAVESRSPAVETTATEPQPVKLHLEPLDEDEEFLTRVSGGSEERVVVQAGDMTNLYVVCSGPTPVEAVFTTPETSLKMTVPCDGIVSRRQVYTDRGSEFVVEYSSDSDTRWKSILTRL